MTDEQSEQHQPSGAEPTERREAYFSGRVQGVGFRYTVESIAEQLPVTGFVRNLPDGRVKLVAEGSPQALDELFERTGDELGRFIAGSEVVRRPATGEFSKFEIAF